MGMSGNIQTVPLVDLLQWITSDNRTGVLILQREGHERKVYFKKGRVISFSSSDERDRFGQFLVHAGVLTPITLAKVLDEQSKTKRPLGRAVVDLGIMSEDDVRAKLRSHATELCTALFLWKEGSFEFVSEEVQVDEADFVGFAISVDEILLEAHRRIDEWSRIKKVFPQEDMVPRLNPEKALTALSELDGNSIDYMLLEHIDGRRSISDLYSGIPASEFVLYEALYRLHSDLIISVSDKPVVKDITGEFIAPGEAPVVDNTEELALGDVGGVAEEDVVEEEIAPEPEPEPEPPPPPPPPKPEPPKAEAPKPAPPKPSKPEPKPEPPKPKPEPPRTEAPKVQPPPAPSGGGSKMPMMIGGVVVLVLAVAVGGFMMMGGKDEPPVEPTPTAAPVTPTTPTPTPSPTPTPTATTPATPSPAEEAAALVAEAQKLFDAKKFSEAEQVARNALDLEGGNAQAQSILDKIEEAQTAGKAGEVIAKGKGEERRGRLEQAAKFYREALTLDPGNSSATSLLRNVEARIEREKELAPVLAKLESAVKSGDVEASKGHLAQAERIDPRDSRVVKLKRQIGELESKAVEAAQAEEKRKQAAAKADAVSQALSSGDLPAAEAALAELERLDSAHPQLASFKKQIADAKAKPKGTVSVGSPLLTGVGYAPLQFKNKVSPEYPAASLDAGTSGKVLVSVTVLPDGSVKDAKLVKQAPAGTGFNEAVLAAAKQWRFEPPTKDDGSAAEESLWSVVVKFNP